MPTRKTTHPNPEIFLILAPGSFWTRPPSLSPHGGRIWDKCRVILTNDTEVEGWVDVAWGKRVHFKIDGIDRAASFEGRLDFGRMIMDFRKKRE